MSHNNLLMIGCGILKKEINFLNTKNNWNLDRTFLNSALHIDFDTLSKSLTETLNKYAHRKKFVFYGCCHPSIDKYIDDANTVRTQGQNCVEMLLGKDKFTHELESGAFFLLEDWAIRWDSIVRKTFGENLKIIREIYQSGHSYLLCINTPCSSDFSEAAKAAGEMVGLPVKSIDVSLTLLESVLLETLEKTKNDTKY